MREYFIVQSAPVSLAECLSLRDAAKAEFEFAEFPGNANTPNILAGNSMPGLDCFTSDTGVVRIDVHGVSDAPAIAKFLSVNAPSLHQVRLNFGRNHPVAAAIVGRGNIGTGVRANHDRKIQPYLSIDLNPDLMQAMDRAELLAAFSRACHQPPLEIDNTGDQVSVSLPAESLVGLAGDRPDLDTTRTVTEPTTFYLTGLSDTMHAWQSMQPLLETARTGLPSSASVSITASDSNEYQDIRQALPDTAFSTSDTAWIIQPTHSQLSSDAENLLSRGDASGAVQSVPLLSFPLTSQFLSGAVLTLHQDSEQNWFVAVASFKKANAPALKDWLSKTSEAMFPAA